MKVNLQKTLDELIDLLPEMCQPRFDSFDRSILLSVCEHISKYQETRNPDFLERAASMLSQFAPPGPEKIDPEESDRNHYQRMEARSLIRLAYAQIELYLIDLDIKLRCVSSR